MSPTRRPLPKRATTEARAAAPRRAARAGSSSRSTIGAGDRRRVADRHDDAGLAVGRRRPRRRRRGSRPPDGRRPSPRSARPASLRSSRSGRRRRGRRRGDRGRRASRGSGPGRRGPTARAAVSSSARRSPSPTIRKTMSGRHRRDRLGRGQEHFVRLDRHQARDDADERRIGRQAELAAQLAAPGRRRDQRIEVEAERHHHRPDRRRRCPGRARHAGPRAVTATSALAPRASTRSAATTRRVFSGEKYASNTCPW